MPVEFEDLVADLGMDVFAREYWEQKVYRFAAGFAGHISSAELEALIASLGTPDANWIQLVKEGKGIAPARFTNGQGFVDLAAVYDAYLDGYTLQLSKMQIRHRPTGQFCRTAEHALLAHGIDLARTVGSHLYRTPPSCRGLLPHYDDHNVFVLQIAGTKHWRLYETAVRPAKRQTKAMDLDKLPPLTHEIELRTGEGLYLPRGCYHEASTGAEASTHLTLDVYALTMLDVIHRAVQDLADDMPAVQPGLSDAGAITALVQPMLDRLDLGGALSNLRVELRDALYPLPGAGLDQLDNLDALTPHSVVHLRSGSAPCLSLSEDEVRISFGGSVIALPKEAKASVEFIGNTPEFTIGALPGPLTLEAKIDLVRLLVANGLIELERGA